MNATVAAKAFDSITGEEVYSVFSLLAKGKPGAVAGMIETLAKARETKWLRMLLDSGIAADIGQALPSLRSAVFKSLLQIEASGAADAETYALVDDWRTALAVTPDQLQADIGSVNDIDTLRCYVRLGASPNRPIDTSRGDNTALLSAALDSRGPAVKAILDLLAESGELPLSRIALDTMTAPETFFDTLLGKELGTPLQQLTVNHLSSMNLPESWKREMAYAINAHKFPTVTGTTIVQRPYRQMLALAQFESPQHFKDEIVSREHFLSESLVREDRDGDRLPILEKMRDEKLDFDAIPCTFYQQNAGRASCTMLHAAVYYGTISAVQLLLDAGANPYAVIQPPPGTWPKHRAVGLDAFGLAALAPQSPVADSVQALLNAWRARATMQRVQPTVNKLN